MTRDNAILLILSLLCSPFSICLADETPNVIGVYFDTAGTSVSMSTTVPNQQVTSYVIIRNASAHDGVRSWTGRISVDPFELRPSEFSADPPCWAGWILPPDLWLSCPQPISWAPLTKIFEFLVAVPDPSTPVRIYVQPTVESSQLCYWTPTTPRVALTPSSGSPDQPVATMNAEPPVVAGHSTWGQIKASYH